MASENYAAFIMTFRRPDELRRTIEKILLQTRPPSKILIVDNDPERSAESVTSFFKEQNISYYPVGYNSGPAGAAFHGSCILFREGWDWVLWMDDNDPPVFGDVIENIFKVPGQYKFPDKIGMIGAVGVRFDKRNARIARIPDGLLKGILEVDNIGGGYSPMINRRVFDAGVAPDPKLFFGFEELDYSLSIKRAGFSVLVPGEELFRHRQKAGRLNYKRDLYKEKKPGSLWREYYSTRNVLYILRKKEKAIGGAIMLTFRSALKSIAGYKYGWTYGKKNMSYLLKGIIDGWIGRMGKKDFTI